MFDTVIISGGNIDRDFALVFLKEILKENWKKDEKGRKAKTNEVRLVAADHGVDFFVGTDFVPDFAIGDFDSISASGKAFMQKHPEMQVIRLKPEKDDSDTQSACRFAFEKGAEKILILGATGSRLDHVISNLGLLVWAKDCGKKIVLADANNYIELIESGRMLHKTGQFGKYVSFFPLGSDVEQLSLSGFKYALQNYHLRASDCGLTVSNEMQEECCRVEYASGNLIMIQSRD